MLHLEINVKRRHIYALVAAVALIVTLIPVSSWAAHQFVDVPDSNIFHDDIGWMADNGITLGCNPPTNDRFCPTDNVRRETMAAFMRRLAENQVVDAATAITAEDADKLDGKDSAEVLPIVWAQSDAESNGTTVTGSPAVEINSLSITVPGDGVLVISGTAFVNNNEATRQNYILYPQIDGANVTPMQWAAVMDAGPANEPAEKFSMAYTVSTSVSAGTYTVTQEVGPSSGTADFFWNAEHLTVVFYPEAQSAITTTGALDGASGTPQGE